jgi:hypothetical protein
MLASPQPMLAGPAGTRAARPSPMGRTSDHRHRRRRLSRLTCICGRDRASPGKAEAGRDRPPPGNPMGALRAVREILNNSHIPKSAGTFFIEHAGIWAIGGAGPREGIRRRDCRGCLPCASVRFRGSSIRTGAGTAMGHAARPRATAASTRLSCAPRGEYRPKAHIQAPYA